MSEGPHEERMRLRSRVHELETALQQQAAENARLIFSMETMAVPEIELAQRVIALTEELEKQTAKVAVMQSVVVMARSYIGLTSQDEAGAEVFRRIDNALANLDLRAERMIEENKAMREALAEIKEMGGKTLIAPSHGATYDNGHQFGAFKAFNQAAEIATAALSATQDGKVGDE